jgi:hypothetical protein
VPQSVERFLQAEAAALGEQLDVAAKRLSPERIRRLVGETESSLSPWARYRTASFASVCR